MDNNLKTILTSALAAVGVVVLSALTGIGRPTSTTEIIHTTDGISLEAVLKSVDEKVGALGENLDKVSELAVDITNRGTKEVRQEVVKQAKILRTEKIAAATDTMKKAVEAAEAKRAAETRAAQEKEKTDRTDVFGMRAARQ